MKKRNTFLCCMLILIFTFIVPIQATAYDYNESDVIIDFLPGDIDENYRVNSADARLCLRAAANLETLTDEQIKTVDFDGTGEIRSANARSILRAAAKLDTLTYAVKLKPEQKLIIGPLIAPSGQEWIITPQAAQKLNIIISKIHDTNGKIGSAPHKLVEASSAETGIYTLSFAQTIGWSQEVRKSFNITLFII